MLTRGQVKVPASYAAQLMGGEGQAQLIWAQLICSFLKVGRLRGW